MIHSLTWISFNTQGGWYTSPASSTCCSMAASSSGYAVFSSTWFGKRSDTSDMKSGSSSSAIKKKVNINTKIQPEEQNNIKWTSVIHFQSSYNMALPSVREMQIFTPPPLQLSMHWAYVPMSFERFISRRTLITIVLSLSLELTLLAAPKVRSTDRMFRRPKS